MSHIGIYRKIVFKQIIDTFAAGIFEASSDNISFDFIRSTINNIKISYIAAQYLDVIENLKY